MSRFAGKPFISLIIVFVLSTAIDQGTKQWAHHALLADSFHEFTDRYPTCGNATEELNRARFVHQNATPITVISNLFSFRYVENCSAAFNLMGNMPESLRFPFFLFISILACVIIPYMYLKTPAEQKWMLWALPFILTGALGNLLDRMLFRYVIDFVDWYVVVGTKEYHWPTFNVADAAIVVGIGLMILQLLLAPKPAAAKPADHA